jgi:hypothetical protein
MGADQVERSDGICTVLDGDGHAVNQRTIEGSNLNVKYWSEHDNAARAGDRRVWFIKSGL